MSEPDFGELVTEAEQINMEIEGAGELPKIERSLGQILEASLALWSRVSVTGAQDIQANLLLGTKGLDLPHMTQKCQSLSSRRTFEPVDPLPVTDIHNFLKNEKETAILQLIESTHQATFSSIESLHKEKLSEEWSEQKINLMNSLLGYSKQIIDIPQRLEKTILNETLFGTKSSLSQEEMAYVRCLIDHNQASMSGQNKSNLLEKFSEAAKAFNNMKVCEMWKMFTYMTQLPAQSEKDFQKARCLPAMQEKMVIQALGYLEERYRHYMTSVVSRNMNVARRGGLPGTYSLVRGFVNVKIAPDPCLEDVQVEGLPLWPLVYYSLRSGDISSAIQCVKNAGASNEEMLKVLEDLKESPNRRLSLRIEMQMRSTYRRLVRTGSDPYKRAVYCALAACDVHDDHKKVVLTADDYLWLKLRQVREEDTETIPDRIHYSLLQSLILEDYGEAHYRASEQPHVYFQMLVLTGQWESAIDFLVRAENFQSHAVHMAIALHDLGLLALPASVNSPLLVIDEIDKPPLRRLNILRLVLLYTRKFEASDPKETLHYYFCMRNLSTKDGSSAFTTCVSNLVLETKQFDLMLGTIKPDGCRSPGLIDSFASQNVEPASIVENVAICSEERGQIEEAIKLYELCGNHEKVLSLLNGLLSQVVSRKTSESTSTRTRLVKTANEIRNRYAGVDIDCRCSTLSTFNTLFDLASFFDLYHTQQYPAALNAIQKTNLIPNTLNEVNDRVSAFKNLDESVCRNIPDVLIATMTIYHHQYLQTQGESTTINKIEDPVKTKQLSFIREKAKVIVSFAGTIPYRMPGDSYNRLVQLEIMIN